MLTTLKASSIPQTEPPAPVLAPPASRRVEAKMNTRFRIRSAAVDLFRDHGFNNVTTEQIAARVGVTQRTLFRHFRTKDAILFDDDSLVEFFDHVLTTRMQTHPPIDAIRLALRDISASYDRNAEAFRTSHQVIVESEMLQAFARYRTSRIDELIALAIDGQTAFAQRAAPPSVGARIAASAIMGLVRPVTDAWLAGDLDRPLVEIADTLWPVLKSILSQCDALIATIGSGLPAATPPGRDPAPTDM